ncbi:hypothetical protein PROVRUST_05667 [Providencia rustigianii DSM 4541]|uniref:Uncharacterized protein n=1 Tax=Providencia rustigianii DSM 4541 TaxID=500637 RepID=D1P0K0_9GAMM|nr:hypothetical protein PROVRUST_05667 [Providencia rustigianii DSM 4541]
MLRHPKGWRQFLGCFLCLAYFFSGIYAKFGSVLFPLNCR